MKNPYSFPRKSRKTIEAYLRDHEHYHPLSSWNGGFVLAWDIKVPFGFDTMGGHGGETRNPSRDNKWRAHVENSDSLFWGCCEDATRQYVDSEWTNYPGIEQREWGFGINGRSGGYLILQEAPSWLPAPRAWKLFSMSWDSRGGFEEWLKELPFKTLLQFYRAIRVLDMDLSKPSIRREMEYQFSFRRTRWEERQDKKAMAGAQAQEESRPDLYPISLA